MENFCRSHLANHSRKTYKEFPNVFNIIVSLTNEEKEVDENEDEEEEEKDEE